MARTAGMDATLADAPPLRLPPLSLLKLAAPLIEVDARIADGQKAKEQAASARAAAQTAADAYANAPLEQRMAAQLAAEQAQDRITQMEALSTAADKNIADAQRWMDGFEYLPELGNLEALEIFVPGSGTPSTDGALKRTDSTQTAKAWYDPFEVIAHDDRSLFGLKSYTDRAERAMRAELAHEAWQVEREFWTGEKVPTNYHLNASPSTPTTSPHRSIDAWPNPSAAPTTVLGTAVGLKQSLASLDQAIANSDAGVGMIHATPYLVQLWSSVFPFLRDGSGNIYTVNMNYIVPGYGYPGTGPDAASRSVADAVTTNASRTVTSATAAFTVADIGKSITTADLPAGTFIVAVASATSITVSKAATAGHAGQTIAIGAGAGDATESTTQWAYATDMVYKCAGPVMTLPYDLNEAVPEVNVSNSADVRSERAYALITNRLLRAAVLVDTTVL